MTATKAFAALRGPSVLGRVLRLEERREVAALGQPRDRELDPARARPPTLVAAAVPLRRPQRRARTLRRSRRGLDLQLHQPLGRKGQHLAHEIGVRPLLHEIEKGHPLVGHRRLSGQGPGPATRTSAPKIDDGRPRRQRHQPPTLPGEALPGAYSVTAERAPERSAASRSPPPEPRDGGARGRARGADRGLRGRPRGPRGARVPPVPDRGRHRRMRHGRRGAARPAPAALSGGGPRGRARARAHRLGLAPLRRLGGAGPHPHASLRGAGRAHGRRGAAHAGGRHARPSGRRGSRPARGADGGDDGAPAADAGAVGLVAVLARARQRARLLPVIGVRRHAAHGDAAALRLLGRVRGRGARPRGAGRDRRRLAHLLGPAAEPRLPHRGDAHLRRLPPA